MLSPERLESLCLKRMYQDIYRHAVNHEEQSSARSDGATSDYCQFQLMFSDATVQEFMDTEGSTDSIRDRLMKYGPTAYLSYMKFMCNPFVHTVFITEDENFNDEVASFITANCSRNLRDLVLEKKDVASASTISLLKSMGNLERLDVYNCNFDSMRTMKVISDYLVNLRYITLIDVFLDDKDLFVLCGHDSTLDDWTSDCSFTNNCRVESNLKLQEIEIEVDGITTAGLACLLTHIPTLSIMSCTPSVTEVIYEISKYRRERAIPRIELGLVEGIFESEPEILEASLEACPNLRKLDVGIDLGSESTAIASVLEGSELNSLSSFFIRCESIHDLINVSFRNFWTNKGPQLKDLVLFLGSFSGREQDYLEFILQNCQAVSSLTVDLNATHTADVVLTDFPDIPSLETMKLSLEGDEDFANAIAKKLIMAASNLEVLTLNFVVNCNALFPVLSENHLRHLREVSIFENDKLETENIVKFLCSGRRKIKIFSPYC